MPNVLVTPENAAIYGYDKLGATINTDTGGIVNPFSGPADGIDARAGRNAAIQSRALANPQYVAPGYSQIMSDPRNVAFNQRLLGDSAFAWDNLQRGFANQVDGNNPMLFYSGSPASSPNAVQRSPMITLPSGTPNATQSTFRYGNSTQTPAKTDPLTGGSTAGVTQATGQNVSNPLGGTPNPQTTSSAPSYSTDSGQGMFALGDPSKSGGTGFQTSPVPGVQRSTAEYNPRDGVVNAMTKRFDARKWF